MQAKTDVRDSSVNLQKKLLFTHTTFIAGVATACLLNVASVAAQSSVVGPAGSSVNRPTGTDNGERVLVLRTGRVMQGRIKTISTGWLVSTDRGNAVIPFGQVHFDADDLNEAYLRLRIQNGSPTVASHLRLAEWCLSQGIMAEAARELRDALDKDPANETARLMLDRVDTEIRRRTPQEPEPEATQDVVILTEQEAPAEDREVRSLSGLSPETAREFVASIQPLFLNKCGNARCHGTASDNEFQLTRMRAGASNSRIVSESNLAAVLNYLQPSQNGQARLLEIVRRSHAGRTIFNGRYGAVQLQTLQQWSRTVTRELRFEMQPVDPTAFSSRPAVPSQFPSAGDDTPIVDSSKAQRDTGSGVPQVVSASAQFPDRHAETSERLIKYAIPGSDAESSPTPLTNVQRLLQEARQHVRKQDAFDPEEFNRRYAGSRTQ